MIKRLLHAWRKWRAPVYCAFNHPVRCDWITGADDKTYIIYYKYVDGIYYVVKEETR